jgi:hypothetical protein
MFELEHFDLGAGLDAAENLIPEGLETRQEGNEASAQLLKQVHVCLLDCLQMLPHNVNKLFPIQVKNVC